MFCMTLRCENDWFISSTVEVGTFCWKSWKHRVCSTFALYTHFMNLGRIRYFACDFLYAIYKFGLLELTSIHFHFWVGTFQQFNQFLVRQSAALATIKATETTTMTTTTTLVVAMAKKKRNTRDEQANKMTYHNYFWII